MSPASFVRRAPPAEAPLVAVGGAPLTVESVLAVARGEARIALDADPQTRRRLRASAATLRRRLEAGEQIYGVTTGFGDSCENEISRDGARALPLNLVRFHGCGTGPALGQAEAAAVVVARIASLVRGYSAIREEVLDRLCLFLNAGVLPQIPSEGSVGASGDLTPLSYIAATLIGEREVTLGNDVVSAGAAHEALGITALSLAPKEGLALMNGTSAMTGLACLAFGRAARLARLAAAVTAMLSDVQRGNRAHFHSRIFELKPHPGQALVARWIREDIALDEAAERPTGERIQDRYSIRCAPHVIGVLADALLSMRSTLEIELNSVNDNPLVDSEADLLLHGGNFYGGHVCFVMDGLKAAVASVADLMDRQLVALCSPTSNGGLPRDLVGRTGPDSAHHHGFKAMQISTSALAAEALKLTMPAAAFSRSTESHNQDKVSMGTIAARDALRVVELTEQVAAIVLLAACQAVDLRKQERCHDRSLALRGAVRETVPFNDADRRQDVDIVSVLERHRAGALPIGEVDPLLGATTT